MSEETGGQITNPNNEGFIEVAKESGLTTYQWQRGVAIVNFEKRVIFAMDTAGREGYLHAFRRQPNVALQTAQDRWWEIYQEALNGGDNTEEASRKALKASDAIAREKGLAGVRTLGEIGFVSVEYSDEPGGNDPRRTIEQTDPITGEQFYEFPVSLNGLTTYLELHSVTKRPIPNLVQDARSYFSKRQ